MDGSERPKAHSYCQLEDNHSWTLSLSITGLVCLVFLQHSILMLLSNHKAFIVFHVSAPLIWTWYTADLLPGTVFSDTTSVGVNASWQTVGLRGIRLWFNCCFLFCFFFAGEFQLVRLLFFHFTSHVSRCHPPAPSGKPSQVIPCVTKHWIEEMACKRPPSSADMHYVSMKKPAIRHYQLAVLWLSMTPEMLII